MTRFASPLLRFLRLFDERRNVLRLVRSLAALCGALAVTDLALWLLRGAEGPLPAWQGFYGLVMCVFLVLAAKGLRVFLKRPEAYYAPRAIDAEEEKAP